MLLNWKSALRFKVSPGTSFAQLASDLAAQGAVEQPRAWILYARWKGLASAVKAGEYEIQPGITPRELLTKMVNGQVLLHSFTIVDGWRVQDLLEALHRNSDIATTLPAQASAAAQAAGVMEKIGAPGTDAEGQFLPETYRFVGGTTDIELLRIAHVALVKELDSAWDARTDLAAGNSELLIMPRSSEERRARNSARSPACTCPLSIVCACRRIPPSLRHGRAMMATFAPWT